ncbi:hypothetical protein QBC41DRAFT_270230 [Cercophora samala]|uniref:Uncharacterized protein n=1 Tax=Cercophora samala TaxID=330535 RepID=A0AA39ZIB8_9PEZI|nr:hypothetical protein QBC41DRAFT_270230 [Cercophora samala]
MNISINTRCTFCDHQRCLHCHVDTIRALNEEDLEIVPSEPSQRETRPLPDARLASKPSSSREPNAHAHLAPRLDSDGYDDSDGSDLESIFSEAPSLASSQSSVPNAVDNSAIDELKYMLLNHEMLEPVLATALSRVGPDRFQRNFRRLLVRYSRGLRKEAGTGLQMKAAKFVQAAALRVSIAIRNEIEVNGERSNKGKTRAKLLAYLTQDVPSSDEESDYDTEEAALQTLDDVKNFMVSSSAFSALNRSLRSWIKMDEFEGSVDATALKINHDLSLGASYLPGVATSITEQSPSDQRSPFRLAWRQCGNIISDLFQGAVPAGQFRISWTCRCGRRLRLQVPELQERAAKAFAIEAAGGNVNTITSQRPSQHTPEASSIQASSNTGSETPRGLSPQLHSPYTSPSEDESQFAPPFIPTGTKKFLLLCVNTMSLRGVRQRRLVNVDITDVECGGELFQKLQNAYHALRKTPFLNSLLVPKTMHYVKFQLLFLQKSGEVIGNYELNSIPSIHEVLKQEYSFRPCPPLIGKLPIPPDIFMHAFLDPGDHLGPMAVEVLPKKLWAELRWDGQANDHFNLPTGWGFYIVEGTHWGLVWWWTVLVLGTVTILTVAWSALMHDVQGGTGLGQYCLAAVALLGSVGLWHYNARARS